MRNLFARGRHGFGFLCLEQRIYKLIAGERVFIIYETAHAIDQASSYVGQAGVCDTGVQPKGT